MPRKRPTPNKPAEWGGFIELRLTDEERTQFAQFNELFQWTFIDDILADEIKLGISYDTQSETYLATLTSEKHAGTNLRCVLTARANSWEKAVSLALFKHLNLLEGDWGQYKPSTGRGSEV